MLARLGLLLGLLAPAFPEELPFVMEYVGPESCPESAWTERLAALLERGDVDPERVVAVRVTVDEGDAVWRANLLVRHREGRSERAFDGDSCAGVLDAAGFVVAAAMAPREAVLVPPVSDEAVDPVAPPVERDAPVDVPTPVSFVPEPAPTVSATRSSRPATPERRAVVELDAAVGMDAVALPGTGAVIRGSLVAGRRWWRIGAAGGYHTPRIKRSSVDARVRGRFDLWSIGPRACAAPSIGRWSFRACGAFEVGQVRGKGEGPAVLEPRRADRLWLAPGALVGAMFHPTDRLGVGLDLDAAIPLRRPRFFVDGLPVPIHEVGPVMVRGLLTVTVRLW